MPVGAPRSPARLHTHKSTHTHTENQKKTAYKTLETQKESENQRISMRTNLEILNSFDLIKGKYKVMMRERRTDALQREALVPDAHYSMQFLG